MISWVQYSVRVDVVERMELNSQYWEELYNRARDLHTDDSSLLLKVCPRCGWIGRTGLSWCTRRHLHNDSVKLNVVPKELEAEVLKQ